MAPGPPRWGDASARMRAASRRSGSGTPVVAADAGRPPGGDRAAYVVPAGRTTSQVLLVGPPLRDDEVENSQQEREIRARQRLEVQTRPVGGQRRRRGEPRVDDHQPAAVASPGQVLHERRHRVGDVAAEQQHRPGAADVLDRERQSAVDPERPVAGRRGRAHAEPAVVVDVARAEHDSCELAELVGLLVGQAAPAEHADRVRAVLLPDRREPAGDEAERLVPGRRLELAARAREPAAW